jgi:ribosomal protein S18 acetylase RimI-like enzyme
MSPFLSSCIEPSLAEVTDHLNRCFEGYVVPIHLNAVALAMMVRTDAIDLSASRILWNDDRQVGIGLIARRGVESRLAAMAIAQDARGAGLGRWLIDRLLSEASARDEARMHLEVIEQNPGAVRLYEAAGFQKRRRLLGYRNESLVGREESDLLEVYAADAAITLLGLGEDRLPWQASGEAMAQIAWPNRAFRLGPAVAVTTDTELPQVAIRSIGVPLEQRGQGWGTRLIAGLAARFPGKAWRVPPLFPAESPHNPFVQLGFEEDAISQLQMWRELS